MKKIIMTIIGTFFILMILTVILHGYQKVSKKKPIVLQGQLEAKETNIASKVSGRIDKILVSEGEHIEVGSLIIHMDTPEIDAKVSQARAVRDASAAISNKAQYGARNQEIQMARKQMQRAEAGLEVTQKTYSRVKKLANEGLLSQQKADEAKAKYISTKRQYETAQAQYNMVKEGARKEDINAAKAKAQQGQAVLNEALVAVKETSLTSPVAGEVAEVIPNNGEVIAKGVPIITVVDLNDQRLELNVREDYLRQFTINSTFEGTVPALGDKTVTFKVYASSVLPDFATWRPTRSDQGFDMRTFLIKSRPTRSITNMRPGMSVLIRLPSEAE